MAKEARARLVSPLPVPTNLARGPREDAPPLALALNVAAGPARNKANAIALSSAVRAARVPCTLRRAARARAATAAARTFSSPPRVRPIGPNRSPRPPRLSWCAGCGRCFLTSGLDSDDVSISSLVRCDEWHATRRSMPRPLLLAMPGAGAPTHGRA
eukprot:363611-Chlamydomonas_euryale.AAC.6